MSTSYTYLAIEKALFTCCLERIVRNMKGKLGKVKKVYSLLTSKSLKMRTHQRIRPLNPTGNPNQ